MTKTATARCAALDCTANADRTVVWQQGDAIVDYSHECRTHAIESATVPGSYSVDRSIVATVVLAGIRNPAI